MWALSWRDLFRRLYRGWRDDALTDTAAALTYYGMLCAFPFLLFAVTLAGLLLDERAIAQIVGEASLVVPGEVAKIIESQLTSLQRRANRGVLTFGLAGALWIASGGVSSLARALNRCYGVRETRPFWRARGCAILVTVVATVTGTLAAAIMLFVPLVGKRVGGPLGLALAWLRLPIAGAIFVGLWAFLYWALPNTQSKFRLFTPGSVMGTLLWLAASWGFSFYVAHWGKYDAIYGALGGVIILLVWMWISSLAILLGAEINKALAQARSADPRSDKSTSPVPEPA